MIKAEKIMLKFEPFSLSALINALPYINNNLSPRSDLSAGYLYMWQGGADLQFCIWHDTFAICQRIGEQIAFSYPMGKDPDGMIEELTEYTYNHRLPLRFLPWMKKRLTGSVPIRAYSRRCGRMTDNGVTISIPLKRR